MSRFRSRVTTIARALARKLASAPSPAREPRRILLAHNLLLGDTLLLAPLMAKLAALHPQAERVVLARPVIAPLLSGRPWGWRAEPFDPADPALPARLGEGGGFDLALVLGDNRYGWLARAAGARWIVGFGGDRPAWKNWMLDETHEHPQTPAAWADMAAGLVTGPAPAPYRPGAWPAPTARPIDWERGCPRGAYAVLHVGASSRLKMWPTEAWRALAEALEGRGLSVVWSAGRGEGAGIDAADPEGRWPSFRGTLDLPQLWHLVAGAALLVCPDTGIAHLGRLTDTPTVTLFGPGAANIHGAGEFWRDSPYWPVTVTPFPCRDQTILFRRPISWVRRCQRNTAECDRARCMEAISVNAVLAAADQALARRKPVTAA